MNKDIFTGKGPKVSSSTCHFRGYDSINKTTKALTW